MKGEDGKPLPNAVIKLERKDFNGSYKVKTNKKGQWFQAGLPLGNYDINLEVDGKIVDTVKSVRARLGDPLPINFDLSKQAEQRAALEKADPKLGRAAQSNGTEYDLFIAFRKHHFAETKNLEGLSQVVLKDRL